MSKRDGKYHFSYPPGLVRSEFICSSSSDDTCSSSDNDDCISVDTHWSDEVAVGPSGLSAILNCSIDQKIKKRLRKVLGGEALGECEEHKGARVSSLPSETRTVPVEEHDRIVNELLQRIKDLEDANRRLKHQNEVLLENERRRAETSISREALEKFEDEAEEEAISFSRGIVSEGLALLGDKAPEQSKEELKHKLETETRARERYENNYHYYEKKFNECNKALSELEDKYRKLQAASSASTAVAAPSSSRKLMPPKLDDQSARIKTLEEQNAFLQENISNEDGKLYKELYAECKEELQKLRSERGLIVAGSTENNRQLAALEDRIAELSANTKDESGRFYKDLYQTCQDELRKLRSEQKELISSGASNKRIVELQQEVGDLLDMAQNENKEFYKDLYEECQQKLQLAVKTEVAVREQLQGAQRMQKDLEAQLTRREPPSPGILSAVTTYLTAPRPPVDTTQLNKTIDDLRKQLDEKTKEVSRVNSELESVREQNKTIRQLAKDTQAQISQIEQSLTDVAGVQRQLREADITIANLEETNERLMEQQRQHDLQVTVAQQRTQENDENKQRIRQLEKENTEQQATIMGLRREVAHQENLVRTTNSTCQATVKEYHDRLNALQGGRGRPVVGMIGDDTRGGSLIFTGSSSSRQTSSSHELDDLRRELQLLHRSNGELENAKRDLEYEIATLKKQVRERDGQIDRLTTRLHDLQRLTQPPQQQLTVQDAAQESRQVSNLRREIKLLEEENERLKIGTQQRLQTMQTNITNTSQLSDLEVANRRLEDELRTTQSALRQNERELQGARQRVRELEDQVNTLGTQMVAVRTAAQQQLITQQQVPSEFNVQLRDLMQRLQFFETENFRLRNDNSTLQSELRERAEYASNLEDTLDQQLRTKRPIEGERSVVVAEGSQRKRTAQEEKECETCKQIEQEAKEAIDEVKRQAQEAIEKWRATYVILQQQHTACLEKVKQLEKELAAYKRTQTLLQPAAAKSTSTPSSATKSTKSTKPSSSTKAAATTTTKATPSTIVVTPTPTPTDDEPSLSLVPMQSAVTISREERIADAKDSQVGQTRRLEKEEVEQERKRGRTDPTTILPAVALADQDELASLLNSTSDLLGPILQGSQGQKEEKS